MLERVVLQWQLWLLLLLLLLPGKQLVLALRCQIAMAARMLLHLCLLLERMHAIRMANTVVTLRQLLILALWVRGRCHHRRHARSTGATDGAVYG